MTPELCFEFCIGAGLDLFGLVGEECRCGASLLNKDVWQMAAPRTTGLLLPLAKQLPDTEMQCPVRVYRWIGPFVSGGSVPEHLQMLHHGSDMLRFRLWNSFTILAYSRYFKMLIVSVWALLSLQFLRHVGNTIYVDSIVTGTDISEEQER